ncbi:MAG: glycosyltransferase family 2 protein [Myxococcales bacterium]|nr:glycosyltransferase family 2 protein [Myxococcales bacterium]
MENPNLSVVIAAYQAGATIGRTVDSVRACLGGERLQIIVADDGSDDDTRDQAARPGVEILALPHVGRPAALNAGLAAARGEIVLFTDADCVVPYSWIEDLLDDLKDVDGVGGNLLPSRLTAVELAKVLRYVQEFERNYELAGEYPGICLNGNNMALRLEALRKVGGFDETFLHGADADLTRRLLAAGCRLRRTVQAQVTHLKVDDFRSFLRTMWRRGSTVKFGLKSGEENWGTMLRALCLSPWKWLLIDFRRAPRLAILGPEATGGRAWLAPLVNFAGGIVNALGRIHYYRRFRRGVR